MVARALAPAPVGAMGRTYILSIPPPRAPAAHAYGFGKARNGRTQHHETAPRVLPRLLWEKVAGALAPARGAPRGRGRCRIAVSRPAGSPHLF